MRKIKHIVLHCTATRSNATVGSIQSYWRSVLKWKKPGYHKIIRADGSVAQLAEDEETTNGVGGHNSTCIHISYVGGTDANGVTTADTRTAAQLATMERLCREYKKKYPDAEIVGHNDFTDLKTCPNFDAKKWAKSKGL
jgi:N-acetylmuramoyl-L-alanine amidase